MQALKLMRKKIGAGKHMQTLNTFSIYISAKIKTVRCFGAASIQIPDKIDKIMDKNVLPYNYIKKATSNNILLTALPPACNYWLRIPQDKLEVVSDIMDYVLHAIILLDDVQDGTHYRRNLPAANRVYGAPLSLNSAFFCIMEGFSKVMSLEKSKALNIYCELFREFLNGTALDIYWRDNFVCPNEEEYKSMVLAKIGSYFSMTFDLLQLFSEDQKDYRKLMRTLGLYYTIRDEYTNLAKVEALEEKSRREEFKDLHNLMDCEDITEGRFTLPIIHGLNSSEESTIRSILVQRTTDHNIKQHCVSLLEKVGSLEYTRQTLQHLDTDLRHQIHHLGGNPKMVDFLDELYNWNG